MSDLDDVTAKACSKKIADLREQVEKLAENVVYWKADSAAAWDKCEERRIENEKLTKELFDFKREFKDDREELREAEQQVEKLMKERDAAWSVNPSKSEQVLLEQLAALAEQNEKLRKALSAAATSLWNYQATRGARAADKALEELPDLATPALNRIRAEGMRMAAEICISKRVPNKRSGGVHWRNQACADVINTQADELEQSK